jgi:hypothetical protein
MQGGKGGWRKGIGRIVRVGAEGGGGCRRFVDPGSKLVVEGVKEGLV